MANYQSQYTGEQIDAAVQQAQRIPTLEQNIANGDAECIKRMQGSSNQGVHDNTMDPFYYKSFTGGEQAYADVAAWLDSQHSTETGAIPLGIYRLLINGSWLYVFVNAQNYAQEIYTQVILNGYVAANGDISPGSAMYKRESQLVNETVVWSRWARVMTDEDVANRAIVVDVANYTSDGAVLPRADVYTYNGLPVSHLRTYQSGPDNTCIVICTEHIDAAYQYHIFYEYDGDASNGYTLIGSYDEYNGDIVPQHIKKLFGMTT